MVLYCSPDICHSNPVLCMQSKAVGHVTNDFKGKLRGGVMTMGRMMTYVILIMVP